MPFRQPRRLRASALLLAACIGASACITVQADDISQDLNDPPPASASPMSPLSRFQALRHRASELAMEAIGLLGVHYRYGGMSPENGLDCSGLVQYVFQRAWGKKLPRTAEEISRVGERVDRSDLQPGDLVFYNTLKRGFSHVGIYLGDNKFIHAPSSGGEVRIESMDLAYWKRRFNGARRIETPDNKP